MTSAVVTEDGCWLYTGSKDGSILKWDLRAVTASAPVASTSTSALSPVSEADRPRITKAAYFSKRTPDAALRNPALKAAAEERAAKGKGRENLSGHTDEVLDLAISWDGKVLASAGKDKVIGVWDVEGEGGKWMRGLAGHKDRVAVSTIVSLLPLQLPFRSDR